MSLNNKSKNYLRNKEKSKSKDGNPRAKWIFKVFILAFGLSVFFSFISETLLKKTGIFISFVLLIVIIFLGILFDIIGIAVASGDEKPFHAMAANKIPGGKEAVQLLRNAEIVSSFCNDVVGDISGIISGVAGATIVLKLTIKTYFSFYESNTMIWSIVMTGFISTLTIGGKAIGKVIAINNWKSVIHAVALFLNRLGINLFSNNVKNKKG